jgi:Uma2 family endonuclease
MVMPMVHPDLDAPRRYTVAEVLAFPDPGDGTRYELVDGELLVSPIARREHQVLLHRLHLRLAVYLEPYRMQDVIFITGGDISWSPRDLVIPDLFIVHPDQAKRKWLEIDQLLLVGEVLSRSTWRNDVFTKRRLYQQHVPTYWIFDIDAQTVDVWHPGDEDPQTVKDVLTWRVTADAEELRIPLEGLFRDL